MERSCIRACSGLDRNSTWPATSKLSKVFSGRVDPQTNREMELSGTRTIRPLHPVFSYSLYSILIGSVARKKQMHLN